MLNTSASKKFLSKQINICKNITWDSRGFDFPIAEAH